MSRAGSGDDAPIVETASGRVRGIWEECAVFRGIPYAEPPTGKRRFDRPRKRSPWQGTLDATAFGPTPQRGESGITLIPEHAVPGDDTLSLNIWTPTLDPDAALPVLFWIHGGGFISGSPASPWYDGSAFARDDVILVTISYRLGFDGFGWIDGAVPNRGVLDWICALEWVRDHISAFGGDPGRVTLAGQSAGGSAVLTLLGAPGAQGLFHGVYAMSAAVADPSVAAAKERSERLAELAGVTADVGGFSLLSESRILELQPKITAPSRPHLIRDIQDLLRDGLMIGPIADGEIVLGGAEAAAAHGASAALPLVLGSTDDELSGLFHPGGILDHAPRKALLRTLGASADAAARWLDDPEIKEIGGTKPMLGRYATDAVLRSWVPRVVAAREAAPEAGLTWTYRFSWHADDPPHAGHCIDVPFAFDCLGAPGVERVAGSAPPQELADAVHGGIVDFVRTGDPGWGPDIGGGCPSRIFDLPVSEANDAYATPAKLSPTASGPL